MELIEQKLKTLTSYHGVIVNVRLDEARLPDGSTAKREVVEHPGGVTVLPLEPDGTVWCVRQYRYPLREVITEIPAGKLDVPDEDPLEAAKRELREETGAVCDRLTFIGDFYSSPAILDEVIHMYLAEGLHMGEASPDDDEFLNLISMPLDALCDMAARGEITDGKTQAAVLKVRYIIDKRSKKQ